MDHPVTSRLVAFATDRGTPVEIRQFPEGTRTAVDAAKAVGTPVGAIVKSLVFVAGDEPIMVLVSGANRADEAALGARLGKVIRRASPEEVRQATGAAIGGVTPFGHPAPLRTLMDPDLLAFDEVWCAAGTPESVFPLPPRTLLSLTGAQVWEGA